MKNANFIIFVSFFWFQAYHFDRDDVALPGAHKYFKKASDEEREHAQLLMKFQNQRGGRIVLQNIVVSNQFIISPIIFLCAFSLNLISL